MKAATIYHHTSTRRQGLPYPNAATRKQLLHRFVDLLLIGAIGMAFAAMVLIMPLLA